MITISNQNAPRVLKLRATKTEVGLTAADEQRMTYWRLPRAERRRRAIEAAT